jgi:GAF domain-containing protein
MGAKASAYYAAAEQLGGMHAKLKLAGLTRMTSAQANSLEDTPELLEQFERAFAEIREAAQSSSRAVSPREVVIGTADASTLRQHIQSVLDLMTQRSLVLGDVMETARRVNEVAVDALDVGRVSAWFLDDARTTLTCMDLFERATRKHTSGTELLAKDYPHYFVALTTERTIAAHDAHQDPRTSAFSERYLKPLHITSMLDVPIWVHGRMVGVVCHEHVGPMRHWNADEEKFAYLMSSFVAMAAERRR